MLSAVFNLPALKIANTKLKEMRLSHAGFSVVPAEGQHLEPVEPASQHPLMVEIPDDEIPSDVS